MGVDLAIATPVFLDYTFVGLEGLPGPGEERFAGDMVRSPGGGAITAIGATRLGLTTGIAAPLGRDLPGRFVREALAAEGIETGEPRDIRTPTTVVMPVDGERAMVTVDPGARARRGDVEAFEPRAVGVNLELLELAPSGPHAYVTCGDDDARAFARRIPPRLAGARALFVNGREACVLTGADKPEEAARELAAVRVHRGRDARGARRLRRRRGPARHRRGRGDGPGRGRDRRRRPVRGRLHLGRPARRGPRGADALGEPLRGALGRLADRRRRCGHARRARRRGTPARAAAAPRRRTGGIDMRRIAAFLFLLALLTAGCGAAPGDDNQDAAEDAKKSEQSARKVDVAKAGPVTLTVWDQEVRGGQAAQIKRLNAAFQAKYPNVTIKRVAKSFTDLNATLKLAVSGDRAPDVVQANQGRPVMGQLVKGGLLRPLDAYAEAYGWSDRYSKLLLDLNRFSPDGQTFGEGKLYGVSQMGEIVGVFYNRAKVPEKPETFADFERLLAQAKQARRRAGRVRQPRQVARDPRVPDRPERVRAARPGARLRVRPLRRLVRHAGGPARRRHSCRSGPSAAGSRPTSTARAMTRRGSSSRAARARS